jgi:peptidyl-prolyl cis-trans isomerase A (cyclophilin A)
MEMRPFYDGLTFHRVVPGFVIQGGDPRGDGTGGPGYEIADEIASDLHFDHAGVLAMANRGSHTAGSQFFITDGAAPHLDGHDTIFGQCENLDVVHAIARAPRTTADHPIAPVIIHRALILSASGGVGEP